MKWLDIILDRISKFGLENITPLERHYLNNYDTDEEKYYTLLLENRNSLYRDLYFYDPSKFLFCNPDEINSWYMLDSSDVEDCRLNLIWDNLDIEDSETFKKIFKVPYIYLDLTWNNLPEKHRQNFKKFLKQYYQLG